MLLINRQIASYEWNRSKI